MPLVQDLLLTSECCFLWLLAIYSLIHPKRFFEHLLGSKGFIGIKNIAVNKTNKSSYLAEGNPQ